MVKMIYKQEHVYIHDIKLLKQLLSEIESIFNHDFIMRCNFLDNKFECINYNSLGVFEYTNHSGWGWGATANTLHKEKIEVSLNDNLVICFIPKIDKTKMYVFKNGDDLSFDEINEINEILKYCFSILHDENRREYLKNKIINSMYMKLNSFLIDVESSFSKAKTIEENELPVFANR